MARVRSLHVASSVNAHHLSNVAVVMGRGEERGVPKTSLRPVILNVPRFSDVPTVCHSVPSVALARYVRCPIPATINPSVSAFVNCTQLLRSSLDHGVTWSPEMVVDGTTPQHDGGVGAGLQLASGRLLFPRNGAGSMISDDGGESWRLGSKLQHGGESQAVQLANTSVLMQMRAVATYAYIWLRSDDGGETFGPPLLHTTPFVPDCPTSVLLDEHGRLLLSHPNPTNHTLPRPLGRRNLTISIGAFNAGGTAVWHDAVVVFAGPSGYSSLASVTKWDLDIVGAVGVVYEMSTDGKEPLDFEGVQLAIISMPA
jgi:hypothetical protein